jgi:hypothetical protein
MGNLGSPDKGITWGYILKPPINIYFISRFMDDMELARNYEVKQHK